MNPLWTMYRRELGTYLRTPTGYIIMAAVLLIDGLLFNAWAIGSEGRRSSDVLLTFFYCCSGTTMLASIFIAMRLIAEERQTGTLVLLSTAPIQEWHIIWGKFAAAMTYMKVLTLSTLYMPLLLLMTGKISWGHILAGYLGLILLSSACIAIGLLCSALSPNQLIAAILGSATIAVFVILWLLARIASPPLQDLIAYMAIHDKHFRPFMMGVISSADIVFYLSLTYLALLCATRVLEARRWR